jgi:hypothetical protein
MTLFTAKATTNMLLFFEHGKTEAAMLCLSTFVLSSADAVVESKYKVCWYEAMY